MTDTKKTHRSGFDPTFMELVFSACLLITVTWAAWWLFNQQAFTLAGVNPVSVQSVSSAAITPTTKARPVYPGDMRHHLRFVREIEQGQRKIPHPGLYWGAIRLSAVSGMSLERAFLVLVTLSVFAYVALLLLILSRHLPGTHWAGRILLALALMLVAAIYLPFVSKYMFLLSGSGNVWHNPTMLVLKPVALAAFWLLVQRFLAGALALHVSRDAWIALLMALGVIIKPNYALSFIPAAALWLLLRRDRSWRRILHLGVIFLPSILLLGVQYLVAYQGKKVSAVGFDFLAVWRLFSPWPLLALVQGTAFPLSMLILRWKAIRGNPWLSLAWLNWGAAVLQAALLVETGPRLRHCNFFWGYMLALAFLFLFSSIELITWMRERSGRPWSWIGPSVACMFFGLHLVWGIVYSIRIWSGGPFH